MCGLFTVPVSFMWELYPFVLSLANIGIRWYLSCFTPWQSGWFQASYKLILCSMCSVYENRIRPVSWHQYLLVRIFSLLPSCLCVFRTYWDQVPMQMAWNSEFWIETLVHRCRVRGHAALSFVLISSWFFLWWAFADYPGSICTWNGTACSNHAVWWRLSWITDQRAVCTIRLAQRLPAPDLWHRLERGKCFCDCFSEFVDD